MIARILIRRDTTANWEVTPVLLKQGEFGVEILDNGSRRIKIGDGVRSWNELPYEYISVEEFAYHLTDLGAHNIDEITEALNSIINDNTEIIIQINQELENTKDRVTSVETVNTNQTNILNNLSGIIYQNRIEADESFVVINSNLTSLNNTTSALVNANNDINIKITQVNNNLNTHISNTETELTGIKSNVNILILDNETNRTNIQNLQNDVSGILLNYEELDGTIERVTVLENNVSNLQTISSGLLADNIIFHDSITNLKWGLDNTNNNLSALDARVDTEVERLENKILDTHTSLSGIITNEVGNLHNRIDTEVTALNGIISGIDYTINDRITTEVETLNNKIDIEIENLSGIIDTEITALSGVISGVDYTINNRITTEVETLNNRIDTEVGTINNTISGLEHQINEVIATEIETINNTISGIIEDTANEFEVVHNRITAVENLGKHVGTFDTLADVPTNINGFPNGITVNDFVNIRKDETQGDLPTRYIANNIDNNTGEITFEFDFTYSLDITGKLDRVENFTEDNLVSFDANGNLQDAGRNMAQIDGAIETVAGQLDTDVSRIDEVNNTQDNLISGLRTDVDVNTQGIADLVAWNEEHGRLGVAGTYNQVTGTPANEFEFTDLAEFFEEKINGNTFSEMVTVNVTQPVTYMVALEGIRLLSNVEFIVNFTNTGTHTGSLQVTKSIGRVMLNFYGTWEDAIEIIECDSISLNSSNASFSTMALLNVNCILFGLLPMTYTIDDLQVMFGTELYLLSGTYTIGGLTVQGTLNIGATVNLTVGGVFDTGLIIDNREGRPLDNYITRKEVDANFVRFGDTVVVEIAREIVEQRIDETVNTWLSVPLTAGVGIGSVGQSILRYNPFLKAVSLNIVGATAAAQGAGTRVAFNYVTGTIPTTEPSVNFFVSLAPTTRDGARLTVNFAMSRIDITLTDNIGSPAAINASLTHLIE